jgi:hypothetical protein
MSSPIDFGFGEKLFIGATMLIANMGSKHLDLDLNIYQEQVFKHSLIRRVTLFSLFFVATRDLQMSFFLTAAFVVLTMGLLNPKSKMCIIPEHVLKNGVVDNGDNIITEDEYKRAKEMVEIYEKNVNKQ